MKYFDSIYNKNGCYESKHIATVFMISNSYYGLKDKNNGSIGQHLKMSSLLMVDMNSKLIR